QPQRHALLPQGVRAPVAQPVRGAAELARRQLAHRVSRQRGHGHGRRPQPALRPALVPRSQAVTQLLDLLLSAVLLAGLYALMAYGLGLIYGGVRVVNLAHGGAIMAGAYAGWVLHERWGIDPYLALPLVLLLGFGCGALL